MSKMKNMIATSGVLLYLAQQKILLMRPNRKELLWSVIVFILYERHLQRHQPFVSEEP